MYRARAWVWVMAAAGLAVVGGCGGGRLADPGAALPADEDSAAFLDRMSSQPTVTENDAMRGVLLAADGKDPFGTFAQRVENLRGRKIVDAAWDCGAARPVTRGRLAYMVYQACNMRGGVMLALTGPSRRYCLRELQYRRMMGEGSSLSPVTGMEFVGVVSRAHERIQTGKVPQLEEAAAGQGAAGK